LQRCGDLAWQGCMGMVNGEMMIQKSRAEQTGQIRLFLEEPPKISGRLRAPPPPPSCRTPNKLRATPGASGRLRAPRVPGGIGDVITRKTTLFHLKLSF
jgi:hypothetical protein